MNTKNTMTETEKSKNEQIECVEGVTITNLLKYALSKSKKEFVIRLFIDIDKILTLIEKTDKKQTKILTFSQFKKQFYRIYKQIKHKIEPTDIERFKKFKEQVFDSVYNLMEEEYSEEDEE